MERVARLPSLHGCCKGRLEPVYRLDVAPTGPMRSRACMDMTGAADGREYREGGPQGPPAVLAHRRALAGGRQRQARQRGARRPVHPHYLRPSPARATGCGLFIPTARWIAANNPPHLLAGKPHGQFHHWARAQAVAPAYRDRYRLFTSFPPLPYATRTWVGGWPVADFRWWAHLPCHAWLGAEEQAGVLSTWKGGCSGLSGSKARSRTEWRGSHRATAPEVASACSPPRATGAGTRWCVCRCRVHRRGAPAACPAPRPRSEHRRITGGPLSLTAC